MILFDSGVQGLPLVPGLGVFRAGGSCPKKISKYEGLIEEVIRDVSSALIGLHLKGARNQPTLQDSQSIKIQKTKDMSNTILHREDNCGECGYCCSGDANACKSSKKIERGELSVPILQLCCMEGWQPSCDHEVTSIRRNSK